ncbi:MAG: thymidylate kinase [Candidatus Eremiobacteraeota bacterium]|nr:thymidylate kinase [Candidatus Eremiobacteraeota bacterium]
MEGLDGSGKSTQIKLLHHWLEMEGEKVFFTEWNSSPQVREATRKGKKNQSLTPTTFSLIHCTDFADRYERQILPLLHAGYLILSDRYCYTAFARDAARGCDRAWLRKLYDFARKPDVIFFFNLKPEIAASRILNGRQKLKFYEAGMDLGLSGNSVESFKLFQEKIYQEYLLMTEEFDFIPIDASAQPNIQHREIRAVIQNKIDLQKYKWKTRI